MFPVDSIPAAYHEEREKLDSAKRTAHIQQQQAKVHAAQVAAALKAAKAAQDKPTTQTSQQRPPLTRPVSSTVFGNIFQGFARSNTSTPQARSIASGSTTPVSTPPAKIVSQADIERDMLMASLRAREENKTGQDYAGPGWW